ncbi:MAG: cofactor-independent phosphoglycerate mutase [Bacillota bacterium]|nr:cofactor-independent phosphoglycerate mutase [Bacillota bacterium]
MKYLVLLGDGMADFKNEALGNKTPLDVALKPHIDDLAKKGIMGMVTTVPASLKPGSDVANLSVMGYDPLIYYTGRSPLEAASMGVSLAPTDITFRCNLVTLSSDEPYEEKTMVDYSAGEITTEEAAELMKSVANELNTDEIEFHNGISYRHLMVWHNAKMDFDLTPPHDITDKKITDNLPGGKYADVILGLMKKSVGILKNHPVNLDRIKRGLRPASSIWIWGEGTAPALDSFYEKFGVKGSVVSAVDLVKGIGVCGGLNVVEVEGATGTYNTNYEGKVNAALNEFRNGRDFVYLHFEGPDECGHQGDIKGKIEAIERIDARALKLIIEGFKEMGEDYSILVMPDHPTPLTIRTHVRDAVPFILYRSCDEQNHPDYVYNEDCAASTGVTVAHGYELMKMLIKK